MSEQFKELINVTILLCKYYDEESVTIREIFDSIDTKDKEVSFSIVTIINTVEYTKKKFSLHYYLLNLDENKQIYIGEEAFENNDLNVLETDNARRRSNISSSIKYCSQKVSGMQLSGVEFISAGNHEILAYLFEEEDTDEARKLVREKKFYDLQDKSKIVAFYGFKVNFVE